MQPDSQVLVREFNRRLKAALRHVPNYVRLEAAMEVESHVQDVISRSADPEPEAEQVARILAGFGSPEAYAAALSDQLPATTSTTVSGGAKEVFTALVDLGNGTGRLLYATSRETFFLLKRGARKLWAASLWSGAHLRTALRWIGPHLRTAWRWTGARLRQGATATQGPATSFAKWIGREARRAWTLVRRLAAWAVRVARQTAGGIKASKAWSRTGMERLSGGLRWAMRPLGIAAAGLVALGAFTVAGFSALAPDITGFYVHATNEAVLTWLDGIRARTIGLYTPGDPSAYAGTGTVVMVGALMAGALVTGLLVYYLRLGRRNRSNAVG